MFDAGFAMLFRAVDRIRTQLETADAEFRQVLAEELVCLQRLNDQYIDHWLALDEQIQELMDTYALAPDGESHSPAGSLSLGSAPSTVYAHAVAPVSAAAAAGPAASAADLCVPDVPESWLDSPAWAMD
ncbi:MAG: hypothetical protein IRZ33_08520, partial [Alicyclobacillaceae bacterium]|nr:hypothetical protein [Alicyclobacillaceae bacterium]